MKDIKNYHEAKQYSNIIKSVKAKLRAYKKRIPAVFGKKLLNLTKIPMYTKSGNPVTYNTKSGKKQRYRNVRSWSELNKLYYIVPKSKYKIIKKNHTKNTNLF